MSDRNYGGEHCPDLSVDYLFSQQEGGDTPSRTLSPYGNLSNYLTIPTHGVHSNGGASLLSTERSGDRGATAEAVKQSSSSAETSALLTLVELGREFFKTSA
ncbi:hypothetical protein L873DRAFT_1845084 [Choiromyces venosus 120613-1]|uniref:Uncharacterized protein n=1 Tax=Choiromyces venosus 120613-1 TaxID=1336337 RepID=A0A3N4JT92_9PEZI|nr:hypothetical protein L873DRAFT_1845084 [Choiromyces venosus 120613-1]